MSVGKSKQPALPRPPSPTPSSSSSHSHHNTQQSPALPTEHSYLLGRGTEYTHATPDNIDTGGPPDIILDRRTAAMSPSQLFELPRPKVRHAENAWKTSSNP